ncbi:MAG: pyridoxamine 5'-phosphate oxidase family protein [Candidatus Syntropharchaeia archaeon]
MPKEAMDFFNDPEASKVLATVDANGVINVVPKHTLAAIDEETIAFADIFGDKTNKNLEATNKAAAVAYKLPPAGYQIKGTFQGFQKSGPLFDNFAKQVKEKLNMDIKAVGTIKVEEVYSVFPSP